MDEANIKDAEKDFQIKSLNDQLQKAYNQISKLRVLLKKYNPESSIEDVSDEEIICLQEIRKLKEISDTRDLSYDEIRGFDILHKNLKIIRGENPKSKNKDQFKNTSTKDLLEQLK